MWYGASEMVYKQEDRAGSLFYTIVLNIIPFEIRHTLFKFVPPYCSMNIIGEQLALPIGNLPFD